MKIRSLYKLSNEEWLIFVGIFADKEILKPVRKLLRVIDVEHFLKGVKIIEPDDKVSSRDVAMKFREAIWPFVWLVNAKLESEMIAPIRYGVRPFSEKRANTFFNCITLQDWKKIGNAIQDEFVIKALVRLFKNIARESEFKYLANGVEDILAKSRGYSKYNLKTRIRIFFQRIILKLKLCV